MRFVPLFCAAGYVTAHPPEQIGNDHDFVKDGRAEISGPITGSGVPPSERVPVRNSIAEDYHKGPADSPSVVFIDATCAEICRGGCISEGWMSSPEAVDHGLRDAIPDFLEHGLVGAGNAMSGLGDAAMGGAAGVANGVVDAAKGVASGVAGAANGLNEAIMDGAPELINVGKNKSSLLQTFAAKKLGRRSLLKSFLKKGRGLFNTKFDPSSCLTACETELNQCTEKHIDGVDKHTEETEQYHVDPEIHACEDRTKLQFIQEAGNLKYQMRYGIAPTFQQVAGLAEPLDLITDADLLALTKCASGGEFATINGAAATGLMECMVDATANYAKHVQQGIGKAYDELQKEGDEGDNGFAELTPQLSSESIIPPSGTMDEAIFYVPDVRCFSSCQGLLAKHGMADCQTEGECGTDFGELLFDLGIASAPRSVKDAMKDQQASFEDYETQMDEAHDAKNYNHDDITHDSIEPPIEPEKDLSLDPSEPALESAKGADGFLQYRQAVPVAESLSTGVVASFLNTNQKVQKEAPFCKQQVCAPFPGLWIQGPLHVQMEKAGALDMCHEPVAVEHQHPDMVYGGVLDTDTPLHFTLQSARDRHIDAGRTHAVRLRKAEVLKMASMVLKK